MWRIRILPIALETLLFFVTTGGLAYLSGSSHWKTFWVTVFISTLIFIALKFWENWPILKGLKQLEEMQNRFALRFQAWGVCDVFNMRYQDEMNLRNAANQALIDNGNDFSLLAETAASYIDPAVRRHWDSLKKKLDSGCRLRLLIIDPLCEPKLVRNKANGITGLIDPKLRLDLLKQLQQTYSKVEVRFTKEIYCSLFVSDKGLMYDPYHLGKDTGRVENYFVSIEIAKEGDEKAYWLMNSHFETLWNCSESFSDWKSKNGGILPSF